MLLLGVAFALLCRTVSAVFADEAYNIDYHLAFLGVPQESTTFFHRARPESQASLLYTLSEQNVVGAWNPKDGSIVWRHILQPSTRLNSTFLRAIDGADTIVSGIGQEISARSGYDGRLAWKHTTPGELKDIELLEFGSSKDTFALTGGDYAAVMRLDEKTGAQKWEYKLEGSDVPHQISVSAKSVHVILLHKTILGYLKLRVLTLEPTTGNKLDEYTLSSENELATADTILTVGANTAAPIIVWTDAAHTTLKMNVLGHRNILSFSTNQGKSPITRVSLHAPYHVNSLTHFLVHYQAETENWADVFHIDVKSGKIEKAYSLHRIQEPSTFSVSTSDANVYFTRISQREIITVSSASHGILARWPLTAFGTVGNKYPNYPVFAKTEIAVKSGKVSSIRSAVWLTTGELILIRESQEVWQKTEALADVVTARFVTSSEAKVIAEQIKSATVSNPISAYTQRVSKHVQDLVNFLTGGARLSGLRDWLFSETVVSHSFGFSQTVLCTTSKGLRYALDVSRPIISHVYLDEALFTTIDDEPQKSDDSIEYKLLDNEIKATSGSKTLWTFAPKTNERLISVVYRPYDDPVASIGIVLGNRNVLYKYLNPNLALVATADDSKQTASFHIIDTISGSIISTSTHPNVDLTMPITSIISENWFAYSFTVEHTETTPKGHLLVGGELYESLSSNDRGVLNAATNFTSLSHYDAPFVLSQTYHISEPISKMAVTRTRQGITSKQLIVVLPESDSIIGIPKAVIDPRRPTRDPTKDEQMEGLVKYSPTLDFDPRWHLNHKREVSGIKGVITSPAILESTSLLFAYGLDVFATRLSPSFNFDMLGKDFNKFQMLATVAALAVATVIVGPLVMRKQVNQRWSLFT